MSVGLTKKYGRHFGLEESGRQGANKLEYLDIPSFRDAAGRDALASKM